MDANQALKDVLAKRAGDLQAMVDQSAANHHSLVGRWLEAKEALANFEAHVALALKNLEQGAAAAAPAPVATPAVPPATESPTAASDAPAADTPPTVQ